MTADQIRQQYFDFLIAEGHAVVPSVSLVPENDPTTLFTGSGMQPMMPYLLGETHPKGTRVADSQKCFRSQDIEEVGDNRHTTFFEMLGNWSFGDYFKSEQLKWFFEFLQKLELDPKRLYVSVFAGDQKIGIPADQEAVEIWQQLFKEVGLDAQEVKHPEQEGLVGRIFHYPADKNWWSRAGVPENMPVGEPGGPDSEVFFDFGPELKLHENSEFKDQVCHPNCDCGRFLEIGNNVFMTYQKQSDGSFTELKHKNIDFGGGLERILAAKQANPDVFQTDLFLPIVQKLEDISGHKYSDHLQSFRVIADHLKAAIMMAADGVEPGSKEQEYFSRRLIRRAIRHAHNLGINQAFAAEFVPVVAQIYARAYPSVYNQTKRIQQILELEEKKFQQALKKGLAKFAQLQKLTAENAFYLYESYGMPLELSLEEAQQLNLKIEPAIEQKFQQAKDRHAQSSRSSSAGKFKGGLADHSQTTIKYHTATHLLHAALRKILGNHVEQKGSNITGQRLRFDFSHPQPLTETEKTQIAHQINDWIKADLPVTKQIMPYDQAIKTGAMAFFGEKYPDQVSVYTIGQDTDHDWVSKELCGGPHVEQTGQIGPIKITREKSAAAGIRRLYLELTT